jgi:hypothetical protein
MSHLFKIITDYDYSSIDASAVVVKNMTVGPFEIDEDGRVLPSMAIAAVDASCLICAQGIKDGKLAVLHESRGGKQSKVKTKNVSPEDNQTTLTVSTTEHNNSVQ